MEEFLSKHSMKIKVGTLVAIVFAVGTFAWRTSGVVAQVEDNTKDIVDIQVQVEPIPIIQTDIGYIKEDIREIKDILLKK